MNCVVCNQILEEPKGVLTICKKRECKKVLESLIVGDYVVSWLRDRTALAHLHLTLGYKAFQSARWKLIAHPCPVYFDEHEDLVRSIISIRELFRVTHTNDGELAKRIGKDSYVLVKFTLMSAPSLELVDSSRGYKIFAIPNAEAIENPVFHGSDEDNWYSILRNGLKSCSGTVWQQNGAMEGNGIYLADSISVSLGHCRGDKVIGAYKWTDGPSGKKRLAYVIPDSSHIQLQFIIVSKNIDLSMQKEIIKKIKEYK